MATWHGLTRAGIKNFHHCYRFTVSPFSWHSESFSPARRISVTSGMARFSDSSQTSHDFRFVPEADQPYFDYFAGSLLTPPAHDQLRSSLEEV
jgi:hypothetical protein